MPAKSLDIFYCMMVCMPCLLIERKGFYDHTKKTHDGSMAGHQAEKTMIKDVEKINGLH